MRAFFEALWGEAPGTYGELRLKKGDQMRQTFVSLQAIEQSAIDIMAATIGKSSKAGWDCFYGVLPRDKASGKAADVPPWTSWLWADIDSKNVMGGNFLPAGMKAISLGIINTFHTKPQIIVDSGFGYHCYWHLDRLEPLDRAQAVMAYIADELKGDRVHDAPRILRVPGTRNYKYIPAPDVRLLVFDRTSTVRLADFEGYLPVTKPPRVRHASYAKQGNLPGWLLELIAKGAPRGARSEASYRAMVWMLRYGYAIDQIEEAFAANPTGIGEKYIEKRADGPRWFNLTYEAAVEAA